MSTQWLAGRVLRFEGEASIGSDFVNDGTIGPLGAGPGSLRFSDNVSGIGSFSGDSIFEGSYSRGPGAASVPFGHGTARFDTGSTLTMEIVGGAPGAQFDQLLDLGLLSFDGTLNLVFGTGFVPIAGQQLALFDFDSFSGRLGAADITVTGFDRELLDFSRLAVDGTLTVTAVPEPGTWATLCAGLLAVGGVLNRRRRVE